MSPTDPDEGGSAIRSVGTSTKDDDDSSSSDSSASSSGDSSDSPDDPDKSKAALRAKIRMQAGSLLSTKAPSAASVLKGSSKSRLITEDDALKKTSSHRNVAPVAAAAAVGVAAGAAASSRDPSEDAMKARQKTGEQSQENKRPSVSDYEGGDSKSSLEDSKRSVRFEDPDDDSFDYNVKEAPTTIRFADEKDKKAPARPARPSLVPVTDIDDDDDDDDEETGKVLANAAPQEDEKVKEQILCGVGTNTGAALLIVTILIWGVALPIALSNRNSKESPAETPIPTTIAPSTNNETSVPILPPSLAPTTMAPTVQPALLIDFPPSTVEAIVDPTSPQAMAFQWMFTDPLVHTYDAERQSQRFALATFFYATQGENWTTNNNWLSVDSGMHECFWYAQSPVCNDQQQYTVLELNDNNIDGEIPAEISMLSGLKEIRLHGNSINGTIPVTLSELTQINVLDLQKNIMTGPIPSQLGLLTSLELLWLNETRDATTPAATIPSELGLLTGLSELHLSSTNLNGSVPTELALLPNLDWLTLRHNQLSGSIPSELALLPKLTWLDLAENKLGNTIPTTVGWLNNTLRFLQLEFNNLNGTIPDSLGRLTRVQEVWLQENLLTGFVPPTLCYFERIGKVDSVWVDCDEVVCTCCLCNEYNVDAGADDEDGAANVSPLEEYAATPNFDDSERSNTTNANTTNATSV
jgi:Leucine-rich repeat (LRR) protein